MEKEASVEQLWFGQAESQRQEKVSESNLLTPMLQENGDSYYIYQSQPQERKGIYKGVRKDAGGQFFEADFLLQNGAYVIDDSHEASPFIRLDPEKHTPHSQPIDYESCFNDSEESDSEGIRLSAIRHSKEVSYYVQDIHPHNKLGAGGNGNIYAGLRVVGDKIHRIAVKILMDHSSDEIRFNDSLNKEFEFIQKYQYSQSYCMGNVDQYQKFIAMDELKGPIFENVTSPSLHPDLIGPGVTKRDLWEAFSPSIAFLLLMHNKKLIHRDLKSGNFMFRWVKERPQFIMIDFGAAQKRPRKGQVNDSQHQGSQGMFFDQTPVSEWGKSHDVTHFILIMAAVLSGSPVDTFNYRSNKSHDLRRDIFPDFSRIDLGLNEDIAEVGRVQVPVIQGLDFNELIVDFFKRSLPSSSDVEDIEDVKREERSLLHENDIKKVSKKGRLKLEELKLFFDLVREVFKLMDQLKDFDHKHDGKSCKSEGERQALLKSNHKANAEKTLSQCTLLINIAKLIIHSEGKWYKEVDKRLTRGLNPDNRSTFKDFNFDYKASVIIISDYLNGKINRSDTYDSCGSAGQSSIESFLSSISQEFLRDSSVEEEGCKTRQIACGSILILILCLALLFIYLMEKEKPVPVFNFDQLNFDIIGKEMLNQTIIWYLQALLTSMHFQKGRLFFDGVGVNLTQGIASNFSVSCGPNDSYLPENQYFMVNGQNVTDIEVVRSWDFPLDCVLPTLPPTPGPTTPFPTTTAAPTLPPTTTAVPTPDNPRLDCHLVNSPSMYPGIFCKGTGGAGVDGASMVMITVSSYCLVDDPTVWSGTWSEVLAGAQVDMECRGLGSCTSEVHARLPNQDLPVGFPDSSFICGQTSLRNIPVEKAEVSAAPKGAGPTIMSLFLLGAAAKKLMSHWWGGREEVGQVPAPR